MLCVIRARCKRCGVLLMQLMRRKYESTVMLSRSALVRRASHDPQR